MPFFTVEKCPFSLKSAFLFEKKGFLRGGKTMCPFLEKVPFFSENALFLGKVPEKGCLSPLKKGRGIKPPKPPPPVAAPDITCVQKLQSIKCGCFPGERAKLVLELRKVFPGIFVSHFIIYYHGQHAM